MEMILRRMLPRLRQNDGVHRPRANNLCQHQGDSGPCYYSFHSIDIGEFEVKNQSLKISMGEAVNSLEIGAFCTVNHLTIKRLPIPKDL